MENSEEFYVSISDDTLMGLVLNGLEAFVVGHIRSKGRDYRYTSETGGSIWGHEIQLKDANLYHINAVSTDTSARTDGGSFWTTDKVCLLKQDVVSSYWPEKEFLGDFHTHPFKDKSAAEIEKDRDYDFSKPDKASVKDDSLFNDDERLGYRVGLVLTLCVMQRDAEQEPEYVSNSCIRFNMGNYRMWLEAYVYDRKQKQLVDDIVFQECHRLMGQNGPYTDFGKGAMASPRSKITHEPG